MRLQDQTAIVTGASRGIGRAVALALAADGCKVCVCSRTLEGAQEAAAEIAAAGGTALAVACDVADAAAVKAMVDQVMAAWGRIDILVNNAGITADTLILRMEEDAWNRVLATDLTGAFHCLKAVTGPMMKRRSGRIINISSVVGVSGNAGQANYAAAKAGLIGLTKSAAKELAGRNVLVNAVAPGFIDTDMTRAIPEKSLEKLLERIPLGRTGTAQEIASVVRFLAGPEASYITGQVLVVDGGMFI